LGQKNQKIIFVSFVNSFIIIFGENKYFEKSHLYARIVLGRTLCGANTFPTRNRLSDPKSVFFADLVLSCWFFRSFPE